MWTYLVALLLAAHTSSLVCGQHFGNLVRQASAKLLAHAASPLREEASRLLRSLIVQSSDGSWPAGAEAICGEVIQAIGQRRRVRISYASAADPFRFTVTTVTPCQLAVSHEGCYFLGRCGHGKTMRRFDFRRIRDVQTIPDEQSVREMEETPAVSPPAQAKKRC